MRYHALATDYDGTLAANDTVSSAEITALEQFKRTGRRLILVTGRELPNLLQVFPRVDLFDFVVAENGAVLYRPSDQEILRLAEPPPAALVAALKKRNVEPLSIGNSVLATWHPHETAVLEEIRNLGLEMDIVFNRGAVMVLPSGVNKASGLSTALSQLGLCFHNTVGIGDAENDYAFLSSCECSVAVANAILSIKEKADYITNAAQGAGVSELIYKVIENDLADLEPVLARHKILLGQHDRLEDIGFSPFGITMLICGTSGSGKSTIATGILERLIQKGFQFCLIDPEGDYEGLKGTVQIGNSAVSPSIDEVMQLLRHPAENAVVNLLGVSLSERPSFFASLLPRLLEMRSRTGRPHWIVVDEAHHLLPVHWDGVAQTVPKDLHNAIFITVNPEHLAMPILQSVNMVIAAGDRPDRTIRSFCKAVNDPSPLVPPAALTHGEIVVWCRGQAPIMVKSALTETAHHRHLRKYAAGNLRVDQSFYFRGPAGKMNLRAYNLMSFIRILEGIDDETWLYHLHRGDYARWFKTTIKDEPLSLEAAKIQKDRQLSPIETRAHIKAAILHRYSEPA